jgi:hypothetical protein
MEHLEKRIAVLEQKLWAGSEPPRTHKESSPAKAFDAYGRDSWRN